VVAIRRIMRAVDLHSRRLVEEHGLTGPQLAALREVEQKGPLSPAAIADRIHLSRGTVTGIVARLERRGLLERSPDQADRRSVRIDLTDLGRHVLSRAPSLLQERFRRELSSVEDWEQLLILSTLKRIASMMDASDLDASPHLVTTLEDARTLPASSELPPAEPPPRRPEPA
jgi:DNA-binding MarR family transcriptional regulator